LKATKPLSGYSSDTEILTRQGGWVTFDRLTYLDEVATRSPDGRFEWQVPERIILDRYEGGMVWLHSRTTDLMVAPGSRLLVLKRHRVMRNGERFDLPYTEEILDAGSVLGERWPLVATSRWQPDAPKREFTFTAAREHTYDGRLANLPLPLTVSADDLASFMGMYLAEGHLDPPGRRSYGIWIWQKPGGRGFREYQELLDRILGRSVAHDPRAGGWHFGRKALYEYLAGCGKYAWGKRIPPEVLDLPATSLEKFWEFYCLGDGTNMVAAGRKPLDVISTTSEDMAGRLQEVIQKMGTWSLIQTVDFRKYANKAGIKANRLCYRMVRRAGAVAFASKIEPVPYRGLIGSVRVSAGAVYVRRNNRPVWSGT